MNNKYITIKDAASILGVSKLTLRNWDKNGKLKAYRHPFNNYRIYRVEDIDQVIELIETSPFLIKEKKSLVRKLVVQHLENEELSTDSDKNPESDSTENDSDAQDTK
jgi:DNA (cytosine-5)-methyltransferase 1